MNTAPGTPALFDQSGFANSSIVSAIRSLYRVVGELNDFIDRHIETLKASDNPLIASTGRVLEAAKFGFGLGYLASTVLIAVGQYLLGNTFAAVVTVTTAAVLANPIAMTCAALGAIYYGWNALTNREQEQVLERLSAGMTVGIELIRSLVEFSIRRSRELLDPAQLEGAKQYIKEQAGRFGRSLHDVTRQVGDLVRDSAEWVGYAAGAAGDSIAGAAGRFGTSVKGGAARADEAIKHGLTRGGSGSLKRSANDGASPSETLRAPPNADPARAAAESLSPASEDELDRPAKADG